MRYIELVDLYEMFEATTERLHMYPTQGMLYPDFIKIEIGMAEKMALRALAMTTGLSISKMEEKLKTKGDLGLAAESLLKVKKQATLFKKELLLDVYDALDKLQELLELKVMSTHLPGFLWRS